MKVKKFTFVLILDVFCLFVAVFYSIDGISPTEDYMQTIVGGSELATCKLVGGGCEHIQATANMDACEGKVPGTICSDWYCIYESIGDGSPLDDKECSSPQVNYQFCFNTGTTACTKTQLICGLGGECARQPVTYNGTTFSPQCVDDTNLCGERKTCTTTWGWYSL